MIRCWQCDHQYTHDPQQLYAWLHAILVWMLQSLPQRQHMERSTTGKSGTVGLEMFTLLLNNTCYKIIWIMFRICITTFVTWLHTSMTFFLLFSWVILVIYNYILFDIEELYRTLGNVANMTTKLYQTKQMMWWYVNFKADFLNKDQLYGR